MGAPAAGGGVALRAAAGVDPEDIVQETLIRAREQWPVVSSPAVVYGWCRTVAGRLVVDELRHPHRTREQPHADPADVERAPVLDGPEAAVVADLHIAAIVSALDPRDRDVLAMRLRDLDPGDIARQLSISTNAARQALYRARRSFERLWRTHCGLASIPLSRVRRRLLPVTWPAEPAVSSFTVSAALAFSLFTMGGDAATAPPAARPERRAPRPPAASRRLFERGRGRTWRTPTVVHIRVGGAMSGALADGVTVGCADCVKPVEPPRIGDRLAVTVAGRSVYVSSPRIPGCEQVPITPVVSCEHRP